MLHAAMAGDALFLWTQPALRPPALRRLLREHLPQLDVDAWSKGDAAAKSPATGSVTREGIALDGREAIALLRAAAGREMLGADVAIGHDVAFWCDALRLAAEIVAAQRFLPSAAYDAARKQYRAAWEPLLGERERRLAARLAMAMPDAAPSLERFLGIAVDALVRDRAASTARTNGAPASLHDRWIRALRAPDSVIAGTPAELRALATQIAEWRRPVLEEHAAEYRLCMRVEEPQTDDEPWRIVYLLQSRTDPSLLLATKSAMATAATRRALLAALGRAAQVSPDVAASLRASSSVPSHCALDVTAVYHFLSETAWLLEQAGVGVILPAWWLGKNAKARIVTRARVKAPSTTAGLRADSLLDVNWSIVLGDAVLPARELERLANLKVPLVRVRGQWVHVEPGELRAALDRVKAGRSQLPMAEVAGWNSPRTSRLTRPALHARCSNAWKANDPTRNFRSRKACWRSCGPIRCAAIVGYAF